MAVRSNWSVVEIDAKNMIFFIEDICHLTGQMSITNDAENVCHYFRQTHGKDCRIVYKDTEGLWWEIVMVADGLWDSDFRVAFKPWHGLAWAILKR